MFRNASLASLALFALASSAHANLVSNGSFETPVVPPGTFTSVPTGGTIGAWAVVGGGSVSPIGANYVEGPLSYPAQDGVQWLDLTGNGVNGANGVEQSIATSAGSSYSVSFFIGNLFGPGLGTSSSVEVFANGTSLGLFTNSQGAGLTVLTWQQFFTNFTATGASSVVRFINRDGPNDNLNGLDNIVIDPRTGTTVVPVPAALPLLASGLGLFGLLARRRAGRG